MKRKMNLQQNGFTLTELMLAMVLFSAILVISTVGFIGMNRTFNRGVIKKQLSEGVQAVSDDMTRTMRAQPTESLPKSCYSTDDASVYNQCKNTVGEGWSWLSFSNACYLWQYRSVPNATSGLYKDGGPCATDSLAEKKALLSSRYVVRQGVSIAQIASEGASGTQLYAVSGVFSTVEDEAVHVPADASDTWHCKGTAESSHVATCAVQQFNFIVNARGNSL